MRYFVLLWNPLKFEGYPRFVDEFRRFGFVDLSWSCGVRTDILVDDIVVLRRTGAGVRGIVGLGTVRRATYQAKWYESGEVGNFIDVDWQVLSTEPLISRDNADFASVERLWTAMGGGVLIDNVDGARIADLLRSSLAAEPSVSRLLLREGERTQMMVRVLDRNASVRQHCLDHHKRVCAACGFNPEQTLGSEFSDLMDVHHLNPLAEAQAEGRNTDPVVDCLPLCPTCHRMAHHGMKPGTCRSIEDLKRLAGRWR